MTLAEMPIASAPAPRRFTRAEYYRMWELGFFENQRVELIDGEIIRMAPQNNPHALTVAIINGWLVKTLGDAYTVRCQLPLVASDFTEPEPDFAVLPGSPESQKEHPHSGLLIIEVAATSIAYDRKKALIYASVGVPEYWIIHLPKRRLEVYRHPIADEEAKFGFKYREAFTLEAGEQIKPLELPLVAVNVSRLFPAV
jgi:Uma2 family endonuclease